MLYQCSRVRHLLPNPLWPHKSCAAFCTAAQFQQMDWDVVPLQPEKLHLLFLIVTTNCWNITTWTNTVTRKMRAFFLTVVCRSAFLWFGLVSPMSLSCFCLFITATILASVDVSLSARYHCQLALKQENELFVSFLRNAELF